MDLELNSGHAGNLAGNLMGSRTPDSPHRWLLRLPLPCVVAITIVFTMGPDVVGRSNFLDFLAHASAYAAITVAALVWPTRQGGTFAVDFARGVAIVVFGAALEQAQRLVGRDAQIGDVGANAIGVLGGLILVRIGRAFLRGSRLS
ncbi:MAG TPA: hypothetical protein VGW79_00855 [Actinomycetota bacterium]|nr:hypothetical protein [Actinomycetota bacterium]